MQVTANGGQLGAVIYRHKIANIESIGDEIIVRKNASWLNGIADKSAHIDRSGGGTRIAQNRKIAGVVNARKFEIVAK